MKSGTRFDSAGWDPIEAIELETAVLVRNLELLRRRGDLYVEVDRAGYLLLRTLDAIGAADIVTLATRLGLEKSTAAREVAAMDELDLVQRRPAPEDRRRSVISLTPAGRSAMLAVRRRRCEGTVEMLAGWSKEELGATAALFARYNQAIAQRYLTPDEGRVPVENAKSTENKT